MVQTCQVTFYYIAKLLVLLSTIDNPRLWHRSLWNEATGSNDLKLFIFYKGIKKLNIYAL